jgi:RNA polymerase sigma factor (sigma-70 family)
MSHDLTAFITACAQRDTEAVAAFQETYGVLIYTFPMRVFHLPEDKAGDFYLYAFDTGRIFARLRSFEGRNAARFETYLSGYVLRDLCLEWLRTTEHVELISLDAPVDGATDSTRGRTVQEVLAAPEPPPEATLGASDDLQATQRALDQLDAERRLLLKVLALGTVELDRDDIRCMAHMAERSLWETMQLLEDVMVTLAEKAVKVQEKVQTLHTVAHWIQTYQREIAALEEKMQRHQFQGETTALESCVQAKVEWERKLAWRYQQQATLREEIQKAEMRPSYKDIAQLLNIPLGTVASRIARAREAFGQKLAVVRAEEA